MPPSVNDTFSYGPVTLNYAHTKAVVQDAVYDPSNTDLLYTAVELTVSGVLALGLNTVNIPSLTPAQVMRDLDHYLNLPRQRLRYRVGGETVFAVDPPDGSPNKNALSDSQVGQKLVADAANGPLPQRVQYGISMDSPVLGGGIGVEFTVRFHQFSCRSGAAERRGFASNRYTVDEDFDALGYRTLTTHGLAICRSDLRFRPHQLHELIAPVVLPGYQRLDSHYTVSPDGLRLEYRFRDQEFYLPPPHPAKRASGKVQFASDNAGAKYVGMCSIVLEAGKETNKRELGSLAVRIGTAILDPYMVKGDNQLSPLAQTSYGHSIWENRVEVAFRVNCNPRAIAGKINPAKKLGTVDTFIFDVDNPDGSGPVAREFVKKNQPAIAPAIRGNNAFLQVLAATFQDPCVVQTMTTAGVQPSPGTVYPKQGSGSASVAVGPTTAPAPPSSQKEEVPYDLFQCSIDYDTLTGKTVGAATKKGDEHPEVRLHQPKLDLMVSWTAQRTGATPDIPDPCPGDKNFVLVRQKIRTEEVKQAVQGGAYTHTITGCYWYKVKDPCKVPLVEAIPPFLVREFKNPPPRSARPAQVTLGGDALAPAFGDRTPAAYPAPGADGGPGPAGAARVVPPSGGQAQWDWWMDQLGQLEGQGGGAGTGAGGGPGVSPPPPPTSPPPPGGQPAFKLNPDVVWWRMKTVKPTELMCTGCTKKSEGFTGEMVGGGAFPFPA